MAITKLLRMKETKGADKSVHLKRNIFYICNPEKTESGLWIGGNAGNDPSTIYHTMMQNKEFWGKMDKTQGFHYILSFPPDCGIDEALAFQITQEFCQQLIGENYYHVFTVHNDKKHLHSHVTFDSVSKTDGYKFHSPKGDWQKRIQPITDRLCEKYHLPTLQYEAEKKGVDYGEWQHRNRTDTEEKQKKIDLGRDNRTVYTWNDIIRDDVEEAIDHSENFGEFLQYLKNMEYEIRNGKYLSLKPPGRQRPIRTGRLGNGYSKEDIINRITNKKYQPQMEERFKTYGNREELRDIIFLKIKRNPGWKMTPFQKQFYKRWNNTYFIRKPGKPQNWNYKKDIVEIQKLSDCIKYMIDHDVHNPDDLQSRRDNIQEEMDAIKKELEAVRTRYYKKQPNYLLSKYEKLEKEFFETENPELKNKMDALRTQIESISPISEAVEKREQMKLEIEEYKKVMRDSKQELKRINDIFRFYYGQEPLQKKEEISSDKKSEKREKRGGHTL